MSIVNKGRTLDWESYFLSILFLFLRLFYLSKIDPLRERSRLFFLVFFCVDDDCHWGREAAFLFFSFNLEEGRVLSVVS